MSLAADAKRLSHKPEEFSLVSGGLFNALLERLHLLRPPMELLRERTLVVSGITWLPLLILSVFEGNAWGSHLRIPFLYDVATHARFLIAIPLLFLADYFAYTRMPPVVSQFRRRGIIAEKDRPKFNAILESGPKLTGSVIPEVICLLLAFTLGHALWAQAFSLGGTTWFASAENQAPTLAGLWYEWVSLPFFRFLFFRWFFRLAVWGYLLFRISRLPLNLVSSHPDRVGGIGFLNQVTGSFLPIISAMGVLLSAQVAAKMIETEKLDLKAYKFEGIGVLVIALLFVLVPLLFFTPVLLRARREGLREFGVLGARYTREFEEKWIEGKEKVEPLVGSADIQSLADLANSYEVVKKMNLVVISRGAVLQLLWALALPCLPLLLTTIPLAELLKRLLKLVV